MTGAEDGMRAGEVFSHALLHNLLVRCLHDRRSDGALLF